MSILRRILQIIERRKEIMKTENKSARHNRNKPIESTKAILDKSGNAVCGDPTCGGDIVQVNDSGARACFKCGKKVM